MSVLMSEWTKFRTVRSTFWTLLAMLVLVIGIAVLASEIAVHQINGGSLITPDSAVALGLGGALAGQVALCVLGALAITTEFSSGMFKTSVAAVPNRLLLVVTKFFVLVAVSFVTCAIATTVSAKLSWAIIKNHAADPAGGGATWSQILGAATYMTLIGVAAFGIGLMIKSSAGTISILLGVLLALWIIVNLVPGHTGAVLRKFHPMAFAFSMIFPAIQHDTSTPADLFAPWTGMLLLVLYGVVLTVLGSVLAVARDA